MITAREYNKDIHGSRIYCIDQSCKAPVIFVSARNLSPHFKTTGKNESKHASTCGFYKSLDFIETVNKVGEYQEILLDNGMKEKIIRLNFNKLDPDYESRSVEREINKKEKNSDDVKVKQENEPPSSIGSLSSVVKLMTSYEPDVLSSIIVTMRGRKVPISEIIVDQERAHELLWEDNAIKGMGYFVYGEVDKVLRREKVIYINFKPINNVLFSLVVFDKYFQHFTYTDSDLEGKTILSWGQLRKNTYQDKNTTEIAIKSDKYIEFLYS